MKIEKIQISELIEHPKNARIHTKRNLDAIKNSLSEFGMTKPLLVQRSTMYVIAGNGTLQAMKSLGWTECDCHVLDLDDNRAYALSILDNKTGEMSEWDERTLTETLQSLRDDDLDLLELSGFQDEELDAMLKFQSGELFESSKPKPKSKPKSSDIPQQEVGDGSSIIENAPTVDYQDQVTFNLIGFPYVLADAEQIEEIKCLTEFLHSAEVKVKNAVTKRVFDAIQSILTDEFMR